MDLSSIQFYSNFQELSGRLMSKRGYDDEFEQWLKRRQASLNKVSIDDCYKKGTL